MRTATGQSPTIGAAPGPARRSARTTDVSLALGLVVLAAGAWWATASSPVPMALPGFLAGWIVMMVAMMFPALLPVIRLYLLAAAARSVAAVPFFLSGYLVVWSAVGLPAFVAWRYTAPAVMAGEEWAARLAGATLLVCAAYQLTPLKSACLRRCRTPVNAFMAVRGSLADPAVAFGAGARNGLWCLGCCWALTGILVAVGVMQPWWMAAIAAVVLAEKALPVRRWLPAGGAALAASLGGALLVDPSLLAFLTH